MSSLATSLPVQPDSSIFLRVDEDRFDVMHAMIIGPKDTPYEVSWAGLGALPRPPPLFDGVLRVVVYSEGWNELGWTELDWTGLDRGVCLWLTV